MYWLNDFFSSSCVSDWCNTGLTDSDIHCTCIDCLIGSVAVCLTDIILDLYSTHRFWDIALCLHQLSETLIHFSLSTCMVITCALAEIMQRRLTKTAFEHFSQLVLALFTFIGCACFLMISKWIKQFQRNCVKVPKRFIQQLTEYKSF